MLKLKDAILLKEFIEMIFSPEAKSAAKYSKLWITFEQILLAYPSLYLMESGFNHVHYLQSKLISILNIKRADLQHKPTNLQPNSYHSGLLDYFLHLYCYFHKVLVDVFSDLL